MSSATCAICRTAGHNAATCTSPVLLEKATYLWTTIDEAYTRSEFVYNGAFRNSSIRFAMTRLGNSILNICKRNLRAITFPQWKRIMPIFENTELFQRPERMSELERICYFFRHSAERHFLHPKNKTEYLDMFSHLAKYLIYKKLKDVYEPPVLTANLPPPISISPSSVVQNDVVDEPTVVVNEPIVVVDEDTRPPSNDVQRIELANNIVLNLDNTNQVIVHQHQEPVSSNSSNLVVEIPNDIVEQPPSTPPTNQTSALVPPNAPRRGRGRPRRIPGAENVTVRRGRPPITPAVRSERQLMRRLAREDPHIERRRIMRERLTYKMDGPEVVFQNEDDGCPICCEEMKGESMFALQCGHPFCAGCLGNVINKSAPKCPMCREDISCIHFKQGLAPEPFNQLMQAISNQN
tara:strand:+ start:255 stop:1478 length:1224 start_codon:yes stop_codon:yes gene_type:complete